MTQHTRTAQPSLETLIAAEGKCHEIIEVVEELRADLLQQPGEPDG